MSKEYTLLDIIESSDSPFKSKVFVRPRKDFTFSLLDFSLKEFNPFFPFSFELVSPRVAELFLLEDDSFRLYVSDLYGKHCLAYFFEPLTPPNTREVPCMLELDTNLNLFKLEAKGHLSFSFI